jgi:hypothetical protein
MANKKRNRGVRKALIFLGKFRQISVDRILMLAEVPGLARLTSA